MQFISNKFGSGYLCEIGDVRGNVYCICTACMSIHAEFASWANANAPRMRTSPGYADNIIMLGCQVTDLAILNDLWTLEKLMRNWPGKNFWVGGCLAKRFDIPLPEGVRRLSNVKSDGTWIHDWHLVEWQKPFWQPEVDHRKPTSPGMLFRNMYPLRVSVGCHGKCKYCTINVTRGTPYSLYSQAILNEFLAFDNVVMIADSPDVAIVTFLLKAALEHKKPISIRNIEPHNARVMWDLIEEVSDAKLLPYFHCPVQSAQQIVVEDMGRSWDETKFVLDNARHLHDNTFTATNIIIDYKNFPNRNEEAYERFNYVSWNPYWDGRWDRYAAELRWRQYFGA